ncbi:hypothetical protein PEC302107_35120 [Pectobacterium araliae]|nr:hypothetical protein PEC302107_35120 [Pectobacterium carotovorum subsp. carotovorum]
MTVAVLLALAGGIVAALTLAGERAVDGRARRARWVWLYSPCASMPVIRLSTEELVYGYQQGWGIFPPLNLCCWEGEVTAILGANGRGKPRC